MEIGWCPRGVYRYAWASASLARYGLGRLSGPLHREALSRETDGPGGQVNLAQKVHQADHQGPGGAEKESADHPGELRFEQPPQKQGRQDGADQQGSQGGGVDRPTGEPQAPLQVTQFHSEFVMVSVARAAMEQAPPFDDAG